MNTRADYYFDRTPSKIGKYDVLGIIGHGGMGVVYKAVDPRLDRQVAIKMMTWGFVDDPNLRKRFFREAQSLASLQHPNIVTVYDLGDYEGNPYLVMQYMEGETLDTALVNKRKLSILDKLNIVIQVCNGLAYAHRRFVVHRDIKPANIMLEKDGGIKIFDFGIAHVGVAEQSVTKTGQIIGTPLYMSPEQINGKTVDSRSDLFSLGVVFYQLCADHLPFQGDSPPSTFLKILYDPPPPLRTYLPSYPPELDAIIEHALSKDPVERYDSADDFALDLGHVVKDLRHEVVGRFMREVGESLERAELQKARDLLLQVLRTDPQHQPAAQTLRDVERRIKNEEISGQVQEAERLRKEERRQQAVKQKKEKAVNPPAGTEPRTGMWATIIVGKPAKPVGEAADRLVAVEAELSSRPSPHGLALSVRIFVYAGAGIVLLAGALLAWRALTPNTLAIQVTSTPDGASVTLSAVNQSGFKRECITPHCSLDLSPGTYSLETQREGYGSKKETIEIRPNGQQSFTVQLDPLAQPGSGDHSGTDFDANSRKPAKLEVRGMAGGTQLLVDGKSMGRVGHNGEMSVELPPGEHRVEVVAKNQPSSPVTRNFEGGRALSLVKDDFYPTSLPTAENADWQSVLNSMSVDSVEQFLRTYPRGTHRAEAEAKREQLYWQIAQGSSSIADLEKYIRVYPDSPHTSEATAKIEELDWLRARDGNTVSSFNDYLTRHRDGKHATLAAQEIDKLDFRSVENAIDPALLEDYLSTHPSGENHDRIYSRLDTATWEGTNKQELPALRSYLARFPNGRYVGDANKAITRLTSESKDLQAIKTAIERYRDAYESESPGDMSKAWPTISKEQLKAITELFNRFSAIKLRIECQDADIHVGKQQASASCRQNARYTLRGKVQTEIPSNVNLGFKNLGNGVWVVESVSSQ